MKKDYFFLSIIIITSLVTQSCFRVKKSNGGAQVKKIEERQVNTKDIKLPTGYVIEPVVQNLTFPTAICFDEDGVPYVIEAGYSYGEVWTEPRLLRLEENGTLTTIATGDKNGPWNGVTYDNGFFYIADGGTLKGGRILKISKSGEITALVTDLPTAGDHHTNAPVVKDGYVYFTTGTATNSAVVGIDNYQYGWLKRFTNFHDVPCQDITVNEVNYVTENPLSPEEDQAATGPFKPFGTTVKDGEVIKGRVPCSGAVLRVPVTGGEPELVAWGLRNPYGLIKTDEGKLYVSNNGYDVRGSRPVWGAGDELFEVKEGAWYGWPDYSGGRPVFGREEFKSPGCEPAKPILKVPPGKPQEAIVEFGVHSSSNGMDVITNPDFGRVGDILVAQFGDQAPTVGKVWSPVGFKVVAVNPETGLIQDFVANDVRKNGPASWLNSNGLERPIDVQFTPDGNELYIVDFGILRENENKESLPEKNTGVIWKVSKARQQLSVSEPEK